MDAFLPDRRRWRPKSSTSGCRSKAIGADNYIIVRRIALVSLDATSFDHVLEAIVNYAETWRRLLADFRPAAKAAAAERAESENPSFGSAGFMQV